MKFECENVTHHSQYQFARFFAYNKDIEGLNFIERQEDFLQFLSFGGRFM